MSDLWPWYLMDDWVLDDYVEDGEGDGVDGEQDPRHRRSPRPSL